MRKSSGLRCRGPLFLHRPQNHLTIALVERDNLVHAAKTELVAVGLRDVMRRHLRIGLTTYQLANWGSALGGPVTNDQTSA